MFLNNTTNASEILLNNLCIYTKLNLKKGFIYTEFVYISNKLNNFLFFGGLDYDYT